MNQNLLFVFKKWQSGPVSDGPLRRGGAVKAAVLDDALELQPISVVYSRQALSDGAYFPPQPLARVEGSLAPSCQRLSRPLCPWRSYRSGSGARRRWTKRRCGGWAVVGRRIDVDEGASCIPPSRPAAAVGLPRRHWRGVGEGEGEERILQEGR